MKDGYKVKICGTTSVEDALLAGREGADYVGVVIETGFSKRSLTIEKAADIFKNSPLPTVALVFQMKEDRIHYLIEKLNPYAIQFLSLEDYDTIRRLKSAYPNIYLWQSIHLPCAGNEYDLGGVKEEVMEYMEAGIDMILYDTAAVVDGVKKFGGTGMVSDWSMIKKLMDEVSHKVPVLLAGGINPENVEEAIDSVKPYGVDLCSGVEAYPGKKDPDKVKELIKKVRGKTGV